MHDADIDLDPEDDLATAAAQSFIAPEVEGMLPVSAASWACMEAAKIGIIAGDHSRLTFDAAAFCILHSPDMELRRSARTAAFSEFKFRELVLAWLDEYPDMHADFGETTKAIASALDKYSKLMTRKVEKPLVQAPSSKKNGARSGSRPIARR